MVFWKHRGRVFMSGDQAREGPLGRKVLYVLLASLALVAIAWLALEVWSAFALPH